MMIYVMNSYANRYDPNPIFLIEDGFGLFVYFICLFYLFILFFYIPLYGKFRPTLRCIMSSRSYLEGGMIQDVYVDLLFLINFSMDYICLFICSRVLHRKMIVWRMLLASAAGGLYSVISLFLPFHSWLELICDASVAFLLCLIAYSGNKRGLPSLFLSSFLFVGISMMMGGCMSAIFNLLNKLNLPLDAIREDSISTYFFAILALSAGLISLKSGQIISRRSAITECRLHVRFCEKNFSFLSLIDSGNLVRDPISGRAVIFLDRGVVESSLPLGFIDDFLNGRPQKNIVCKELRLISLHTASGTSLAVAAKPEKLTAEIEDKRGKTICLELDALISFTHLGKGSRGYTAIVPNEIIKQ